VIRVVLTVLIAVALLAASLPALEDARAATTAERLDTEAERVERAVGGVVSGSVAVEDPSLAARTTTTVRAPSGVTARSVERLALVDRGASADTGGRDRVALRYRLDGGPEGVVPVVPSALPADVTVVGEELDLRTGGESRIELRFVDDDGPTVEIMRAG